VSQLGLGCAARHFLVRLRLPQICWKLQIPNAGPLIRVCLRPRLADHTSGYTPIQALDPSFSGLPKKMMKAWIRTAELTALVRMGKWKGANAITAFDVLENPGRIYEHIRDEAGADDHSGWCYVGRPEKLLNKDGVRSYPMPPKTLFVAFLSGGKRLYEWGYEAESPDDPWAPMVDLTRGSVKGRFGSIVWPKTK
jgi:hypothetical protein